MTASAARPPPHLLDRLKALLGPEGWSEDAVELDAHLADWRGRERGFTPLLVKPASTGEVAALVQVCAEAGVAITPQGGNTGLVGGGLPRGEVLLSLKRLRRIRAVDPLDDSLIAEAGTPLVEVQQAAAAAGRLFPLSLGSEGVATIGGLCSTNAGGVAVLRYGMMRDLVLGLEVVLPDGRIWNGLRTLRKDNTGYDLKQLFLGAEGTLGVITAAALKLFARPAATETAVAALADLHASCELLALAKEMSGGGVTAFELLPQRAFDLVLKHIADTRTPFVQPPPWSVLIEVSFGRPEGGRAVLEAILAAALERGLISDAAIAHSLAQAGAFWKVRETLPLALRLEGLALAHDVSAPVSRMPDLIVMAQAEVARLAPGAPVVAFGHVGDGNAHINVGPAPGRELDPALAHAITDAIHAGATALGGSISAEHGIGAQKLAELPLRRSAVEIDLMRKLKHALDPKGVMNPNRIVSFHA
jgi:FAD/FMN-containing dehydrogenase